MLPLEACGKEGTWGRVVEVVEVEVGIRQGKAGREVGICCSKMPTRCITQADSSSLSVFENYGFDRVY